MAYARCNKCGKETHWRARRGASIKDLPACECGGKFIGLTAGQLSKSKGKKYETCVLCGRRRLRLMHPPGPWRQRYRREAETIVRQPGQPVCAHHEPIPSDKPIGWPLFDHDAQEEVAERLYQGDLAEYSAWRSRCWQKPAAVSQVNDDR
jgi:hypothetical protein